MRFGLLWLCLNMLRIDKPKTHKTKTQQPIDQAFQIGKYGKFHQCEQIKAKIYRPRVLLIFASCPRKKGYVLFTFPIFTTPAR